MVNVIAGFESEETMRRLKHLLDGGGYRLVAECRSGAALRRAVSVTSECVVICSAYLPDTTADELAADFEGRAGVLVIDSPMSLANCESNIIVKLPTPLCRGDLLRALSGMGQERKPTRASEDKELIERAKAMIMERRGLTEPQAHRYLQRISMDCCAKMTDVARRITGEDF